MFSACLLLGLLARQLSGRRLIGVIVTALALATPWLFEIGRLAWEVHLVPLLTILYLHAIYRAHNKNKWNWLDITLLVFTLALLTYCYASGRVLGPLMAVGLIFFVTTRRRLFAVGLTWLLYGITLIPMFLFSRNHPGVLLKRFLEVSYLRPTKPLLDNLSQFIKRFLEDQNLTGLLLTGDAHARHHVQGSGGDFFYSAFVLVIIGLFIVIARRWREPWWRFILYGLIAAIVPGAITNWSFHSLRLLTLPVFLLLLTVPALEWLLAGSRKLTGFAPTPKRSTEFKTFDAPAPRTVRLSILSCLVAFTAVETYWFQTVYRRDGPRREAEFDVPYKDAYEAAVKQPSRPIYLEDGHWGPGYIHALWYATMEKRPTSQFAYLEPGTKPPKGAIVLSTGDTPEGCEEILHAYIYRVYKAL